MESSFTSGRGAYEGGWTKRSPTVSIPSNRRGSVTERLESNFEHVQPFLSNRSKSRKIPF